jgi:hypothetical protein
MLLQCGEIVGHGNDGNAAGDERAAEPAKQFRRVDYMLKHVSEQNRVVSQRRFQPVLQKGIDVASGHEYPAVWIHRDHAFQAVIESFDLPARVLEVRKRKPFTAADIE